MFAIALIGIGVVIYIMNQNTDPPKPTLEESTKLPKAKVANKHLLEGVHSALIELIEAWEMNGSHDVVIPNVDIPAGVFRAGLRQGPDAEREQALAVQMGVSQATNLRATPHGFGMAIDVHPVGFNPRIAWSRQTEAMRAKFYAFGVFAENYTASNGIRFTWGGRWRSATFPNGDQPHVELKNWRQYING